MKKVLNECVGCPPEIGCLGSTCPYRNVTRYYCDECGEEEQLYEYDGKELCLDCIEKELTKVN
jgi:hypothetical protein